jgi:hypothetical protein
VKKQIRLRAFFCDPRSPWQRGSIENATAACAAASSAVGSMKSGGDAQQPLVVDIPQCFIEAFER